MSLDRTLAEQLDNHPKAAGWRRKTWLALSTLSNYAVSKQQRRDRDGAPGPEYASLRAYVHPGNPAGARTSCN
ncbi:MAG TPA: hypothetical protein VGN37_20715 [Actinocatenispora sp.]